MIVVGYEKKLTEHPFTEFVEVSRHDDDGEWESAMHELRLSKVGADDVYLFFYGISTSDTEFKVNLVIDADEPLLPDGPEG